MRWRELRGIRMKCVGVRAGRDRGWRDGVWCSRRENGPAKGVCRRGDRAGFGCGNYFGGSGSAAADLFAGGGRFFNVRRVAPADRGAGEWRRRRDARGVGGSAASITYRFRSVPGIGGDGRFASAGIAGMRAERSWSYCAGVLWAWVRNTCRSWCAGFLSGMGMLRRFCGLAWRSADTNYWSRMHTNERE